MELNLLEYLNTQFKEMQKQRIAGTADDLEIEINRLAVKVENTFGYNFTKDELKLLYMSAQTYDDTIRSLKDRERARQKRHRKDINEPRLFP